MATQPQTQALVAPGPEVTGAIEKLEHWGRTLAIRSASDYQNAVEILKRVKGSRQQVVDFFADMKDRAYRSWKGIVATEKGFTDRLDTVEKQAKTACLVYQRAEEEKRLAEQRRLQAEADERARKERMRLEQEAARQRQIEEEARAKAEAARRAAEEANAAERARLLREAEAAERKAAAAAVKVEAKVEQAASVTAPVVEVSTVTPKIEGSSVRKTWKARVTDIAQVPREYLIVNQQALDAFAKATKGSVKLPGVEFYEEQSLAIGGRP